MIRFVLILTWALTPPAYAGPFAMTFPGLARLGFAPDIEARLDHLTRVNPHFTAWVDQFSGHYYAMRPVDECARLLGGEPRRYRERAVRQMLTVFAYLRDDEGPPGLVASHLGRILGFAMLDPDLERIRTLDGIVEGWLRELARLGRGNQPVDLNAFFVNPLYIRDLFDFAMRMRKAGKGPWSVSDFLPPEE